MTSPENQPRRAYNDEHPMQAHEAQDGDERDPGLRYIEVTDQSGTEEHIALRGYGGGDGERADDAAVSDDVDGVARSVVAGPRRVEDGFIPEEQIQEPRKGYGGEDGRLSSGEPVRDDVRGSATREVAGPRRVEEGESTDEAKEINDDDEAAVAVDELAEAIESGEVSHDEAAEKIAELMEQNDALKQQIAGLETQVAELSRLTARLQETLDKLDQVTDGTEPEAKDDSDPLTDEEVVATGNSILEKLGHESDSSEPDALTADEQAALQKRMEEEGDAEHENSAASAEQDETEITPEQYFNEQLVSTRDKYAELTANDRLSYLGRFMKSNGLLSRTVRRIPGVSGMLDGLNSSSTKARALEEARSNYEIAMRELEEFATGTAEIEGKTIEEIRLGATLLQIREEHQLTLGIHDHQMKMGKDGNGFTGWWVRHNGVGGIIVKSGIVLGASLLTGGLAGGIAAGVFGAAAAAGIAGGAAGALTGGGIAKYVHDRRARSIIDKPLNRTVAERDRREDHARMFNERNGTPNERLAVTGDAIAAGEVREPRRAIGPDWVQRMTGVIEARTDEIVKQNRGEMARSIMMGASAGAAAGGFAGNWVDAALHPGAQHNLVNGQQATDAHPNEGTLPSDRYDQMLKGHHFNAERGSSVIREIQQAAQANGHPISMHDAGQIYNDIYHDVGDKIIHGGPEYHGPTGDIRFGHPGAYEWGKGVLDRIVSAAANK